MDLSGHVEASPGSREQTRQAGHRWKTKNRVNECAMLTLSFLVSSDKISRAKASRSRSKTTDVYTSTQEPFLQALVNTESAENVSHLFTVATETAKICCKLALKAQVIQIHKDFSKGIEKSRKDCFPAARPCDDFPAPGVVQDATGIASRITPSCP